MRYILLIFLSFLVYGCKTKFTQFFIDYNSVATISASTPVNVPVDIYTPDQTTNSSQKFQVNDTRKDKIEKITLDELRITITSPQGEDFSFLNEIELYISADGLSEKLVAYKYSINSSIGQVLECDETKEDLQAYIKEDEFTIRLKTVTDEVITQEIEVDIFTNFFVDAKLVN